MTLEQSPVGIRALDVIVGFAIIFLGTWIILDSTILEPTLVFLLALGLIFIGFTRLGKGILMSEVTKSTRAIKIGTGLIAIILAVAALFFSAILVDVLIMLLAFGIMMIGMARLVVGYSEKDINHKTRILYIVGGGIVFLFGLIAAIINDVGEYTLRLTIAVTFLILGSLRVAAGITGETR